MKQSYYLSLLCFFLCFSLSWGQLSKNYEVTTPGTLSQLVGTDKAKITDLSLTGTLNSVDFETIRQMSALKNLDLLNANLVDNTLPEGALRYKIFNELKLPKSLKTIGILAFGDVRIPKLDFSNSLQLEKIERQAFNGLRMTDNVLDFSKNQKLVHYPSTEEGGGAFTHNSSKVILPLNTKILPTMTFSYFKGEAVLPEGLEEISFGGFRYASMPVELKLPKSLKTIGIVAFQGAQLPKLDFSHSLELETIERQAFNGLRMTDNVLDFSNNTKLVNYPSTKEGGGAFTHNSSKVILPLNTMVLPTMTFSYFKGEAILPEGLEVLSYQSFRYASMSAELKLPRSLKTIGILAFGDVRIPKLDFSNSLQLETIERQAFNNLQLTDNVLDFSNNNKLVNYPSTIEGGGAFTHNSSKVILPLNTKILPTMTFSYFKGEAVLPDGLEKISTQAFLYSTIKEISLPSSIKTIGAEAFSGCKELEKLSICAITPPQLGTEVFKGINFSKVELSVPKNNLAKYNQASQWKDFTVTVETDRCVAGPEIIEDPQVNAPNSYIYDVDAAKANNYGGLKIPVAKAYAMWETNEFMERKGIPEGTLSASVYWEDVEGLVRSISVDQNGKDSKMEVMINRAKGKGNAVVALHVGATGNPLKDPVYWSWHVWVTDDPTQGKTYDNNPGSNQHLVNTFMDRNLGALSNSFLGNDWNRSVGLKYQWGRKDPFPSMVYLDGTYATLNTLNKGAINGLNYLNKIQQYRISSKAALNIQQSVQSPFDIIVPPKEELVLNSKGKLIYLPENSWISDDLVRDYYENNKKFYNLWADNSNGVRESGHVFDQKPKSPFDPCPSGWRVPSYAHMFSDNHVSSPWGKVGTDGFPYNEFANPNEIDKSKDARAIFDGLKIYPSLGFDFNGVKDYDIGQYPLTGLYMASADKMIYQDNGSESVLWGATQSDTGNAIVFHLVADQYSTAKGENEIYEREGFYSIDTRELTKGHTISLHGIRCTKENFPVSELTTQYVSENVKNYEEGLLNPNSYQLVKKSSEQKVSIPVNKAFSVYNQYLTDHQWPQGNLSVNVYWTTDPLLIKNVALKGLDENGNIEVQLAPNKSGNAVISLHSGNQGNSEDPVLWSWHIWVTNNEVKSHVYTTEKVHSDVKKDYTSFLAFNTSSGQVPLTTEFMDRNLGAIEFDVSSKDPNVNRLTDLMQYQWGRKDPIPTFLYAGSHAYTNREGGDYSIYLGNNKSGNGISYKEIDAIQYRNNFTGLTNSVTYGLTNTQIIKKMVEIPLLYTYNHAGERRYKNWLSKADANLWGHASGKTIFDPCPDGWRVPDVGLLAMSPWLKEGTTEYIDRAVVTHPIDISTKGFYVLNDDEFIRGIDLSNDSSYNIGQFGTVGGRGTVSYNGFQGLIYNFKGGGTLWLASMLQSGLNNHFNDNSGEAMFIDWSYGGVRYKRLKAIHFSDASYANSIRCAKDQPRFSKESIANTPVNSSVRRNYVEVQSVEEKTSTLTESQIRITPNPTSGLFKVLLTGVTEGKLNVVNINGTVIHSQTFANSTEVDVNIQNQPSGVYVVQVQAQGQVVNKKVIKK